MVAQRSGLARLQPLGYTLPLRGRISRVIELAEDLRDLLIELSDGLAALLKNKRAAGRPQDLADVAALTKKTRV